MCIHNLYLVPHWNNFYEHITNCHWCMTATAGTCQWTTLMIPSSSQFVPVHRHPSIFPYQRYIYYSRESAQVQKGHLTLPDHHPFTQLAHGHCSNAFLTLNFEACNTFFKPKVFKCRTHNRNTEVGSHNLYPVTYSWTKSGIAAAQTVKLLQVAVHTGS